MFRCTSPRLRFNGRGGSLRSRVCLLSLLCPTKQPRFFLFYCLSVLLVPALSVAWSPKLRAGVLFFRTPRGPVTVDTCDAPVLKILGTVYLFSASSVCYVCACSPGDSLSLPIPQCSAGAWRKTWSRSSNGWRRVLFWEVGRAALAVQGAGVNPFRAPKPFPHSISK